MLGLELGSPGLATTRRPREGRLSLGFASGAFGLFGAGFASLEAVPGWTYGRTGGGTARTIAGALAAFPPDAPRRTDRGLLIEPARTNKLTLHNANPADAAGLVKAGGGAATATLSVVDDTAALAAAGLSSVCTSGKAFRVVTHPANGVTYIELGATGNSSPHLLSAYVRGMGSVTLRAYGAAPSGETLTTAYVRRASGFSIDAKAVIQVEQGADLYFILPQLEQGGTLTSPIVTAGATASRGADTVGMSVPEGCSTYALIHDGGTTTGAVVPGETFDLGAASGGAWVGGYVQSLTMD